MNTKLILASVVMTILGLVLLRPFYETEAKGIDLPKDSVGYQPCYSSDVLEFEDPTPVTMSPVPKEEPEYKGLDPFPTKKHLIIIGKITDGVTRVKMKMGGMWECGIFYSDKDVVRGRVLLYAHAIVKEAWKVSEPEHYSNPWILNPWGLAGTVWNESKFDRCALGLHPRTAAYDLGLLKRNSMTISHKEEDVLRAIRDPRMQKRFKKTGFDLGVAQLLSSFYEDPKNYEYMISIDGGTARAAKEMRRRSRMFNTKRPWVYWRGHRTKWYGEKIVKWAKMLGADKNEI